MRRWIIPLLFLTACSEQASSSSDQVEVRWSVNDVSYLYPLPAEGEDALLLKLDSAGDRGPLLPKELYVEHVEQQFGGLWEGFDREKGYAWSRILALRVDPCANALAIEPDTECSAEVRLSAQPLAGGTGENMTSAIDAAIHLLYEVSRPELDALLAELRELATRAEADHQDAPLGPHPVMVREGLSGDFAKGLNRAILAHVGADNLSKFTVMTRGRNSTNWRFLQLERGEDGYVQAPIVATGDATVQGVNELGLEGANNSRDTTVSPVDPEIGYPAELWKSEEAQALPRTKLKAALGRLASYEDPAVHSSKTLDCASCHISANARSFFEKLTGVTTPAALVTFDPPPDQNVKRVDETELSGKAMRAFGYFGEQIAISQRTVNDSARVADWLTRGGP